MKMPAIASIPIIGVLLCGVCCAVPLIAAAGLPVTFAGISSGAVVPAVLAATSGVVLFVGARALSEKKSCSAAISPACDTGCGCKSSRWA